MPRLVIDDSDGSYEGDSPIAQRPDPVSSHPFKQSSGNNSYATESTDPLFFQAVFEEHNDAAQGRRDTVRTLMHRAERHGPSAELLGAATMTPKTNATNELTQMNTSREGATPDPWEIPSSPQVTAGAATLRQRSAPRPESRQAVQQHESVSSPLSSPGASDMDDAHSPVRSRKRRKVARETPNTRAKSTAVITISSGSEDEEDEFSSDDATQPANEASLQVVPQTLSNSQKQQYEVVPPQSSDLLSPMLNRKHLQDVKPNQRSSGSMTNVNTPRSDDPLVANGSSVPQTLQSPANVEKSARGSRLRRRSSSPDIIGAQASRRGKPKSPQKTEHASSDGHESSDWDDSNPSYLGKVRLKDLRTDDEDDEDFGTPAKPSAQKRLQKRSGKQSEPEVAEKAAAEKPRRGRPKKNTTAAVNDAVEAEPPAAPTLDKVPAPKEKRKRGRPRKSDTAEPAAETETGPDTEARVSENPQVAQADSAETKQDTAALKEEEDNDHKPADSPPVDCKSRTKRVPKSSKPLEGKVSTSPAPPSEPAPPATPPKPQTPTADLKKSLSKSTGPLYRVGLSKRSRIAPLLKSVKK